jgi:tRNA A37 methylthiotransferase MiaB
MQGKVKPEEIAARSQRLRALGSEKDRRFQEGFRDRILSALLLRQRTGDGRIVGLTGNYLEVLVEGPDELMNSYALVRLLNRGEDGRWQATLAGQHEFSRS